MFQFTKKIMLVSPQNRNTAQMHRLKGELDLCTLTHLSDLLIKVLQKSGKNPHGLYTTDTILDWMNTYSMWFPTAEYTLLFQHKETLTKNDPIQVYTANLNKFQRTEVQCTHTQLCKLMTHNTRGRRQHVTIMSMAPPSPCPAEIRCSVIQFFKS
jgi:hypothetical protein